MAVVIVVTYIAVVVMVLVFSRGHHAGPDRWPRRLQGQVQDAQEEAEVTNLRECQLDSPC